MQTIILLASEWVKWLTEGMANTRKYDNKLRTLKFRVNSLRVSVFIYRKFYFILIAQISYFSFSIVLSLCAFASLWVWWLCGQQHFTILIGTHTAHSSIVLQLNYIERIKHTRTQPLAQLMFCFFLSLRLGLCFTFSGNFGWTVGKHIWPSLCMTCLLRFLRPYGSRSLSLFLFLNHGAMYTADGTHDLLIISISVMCAVFFGVSVLFFVHCLLACLLACLPACYPTL